MWQRVSQNLSSWIRTFINVSAIKKLNRYDSLYLNTKSVKKRIMIYGDGLNIYQLWI